MEVPEWIPFHSKQLEAAQFIMDYRRVLIAGQMGTGKTLATLLALYNLKLKTLIVAPKSTHVQWQREMRKWNVWRYIDATYTTYESCWKYLNLEYNILVGDESVKIKNPNSQRSEVFYAAAATVRKRNGYIILLSGSPAPRDPRDWWHQLEVLQPGFVREGSPEKLGYRLGNWNFDGEYPVQCKKDPWPRENLERFAKRVKPLVLSIRKRDVLPELPEKIFERVVVPVNNEYREAARAIVDTCDTTIKAITKLRQFSDGFLIRDDEIFSQDGSPKELKLVEDLKHLEDNEIHRVVIMGGFKETLLKIRRVCNDLGWLTGISDGRHKLNLEFLNHFDSDDDAKLAAICYPGCTYGLALQRSPLIIFFSNSFNPDDRSQSTERADRFGKDMSRGTIIRDYLHLPTDTKVLDTIERNLKVEEITLDELRDLLSL